MADDTAQWDRLRDIALHRHLDLRISRLDRSVAVIEMPVAPPALNSSGNLHGGAIATLVDSACGVAAAVAAGVDRTQRTLVTADLHVRYLGRPKTDMVRAEAHVMRAGHQLIVVECRVLDSADNLIAVADFSSMVVPRRLPLAVAERSDPDAPDI
jgi:uncharacterized protein (TIGR00369 family)